MVLSSHLAGRTMERLENGCLSRFRLRIILAGHAFRCGNRGARHGSY